MDEKTCTKCGSPGPFYKQKGGKGGLRSICVACFKAADKGRKRNGAQHRESNRAWKKANREKVNIYNYAWKKANPGRARASVRAWQLAHPEENRAAVRAWRLANPEKCRERARRRRAALAGVLCTLMPKEWQNTLEYFNYACAYRLRTDRPLTQEHIIPITKGGEHTAENVVPACLPCNSSKKNKSLLQVILAC